MLTKEHLLELNSRVINGTGKWKNEKDVGTVLEAINDGNLAWPIRAAKAALAIVTLQIFDDGNHRTALMVLYYLMICGRMMPRRNPLHIYGKMDSLREAFFDALGDDKKQYAVALKLANFMGSKAKKWGPKEFITSHISTIIPTVEKMIDRLPDQLSDIARISKLYGYKSGRYFVLNDGAWRDEDRGKIRMYVAYARGMGYEF